MDVSGLEEGCVTAEFDGYTSTTPLPAPRRPDDVDRESAVAYALRYERNYRRYEALYGHGPPTPERTGVSAHGIPEVRLSDVTTTADRRAGGVVVRLGYTWSVEVADDEFRRAGSRSVGYYVGRDTTVRATAERSDGTPPDPLDRGTVMTC